jgi:hypothetical protein
MARRKRSKPVASDPAATNAGASAALAKTLRVASRILPGVPADDSEICPRWQVIIALGDFISSEPEPIWEFVSKWGAFPDKDLQTAVACCLLEHLLEHHFERFIDRIEQRADECEVFRETLSGCWELGKTELPGNRERFRRATGNSGFDAQVEQLRVEVEHIVGDGNGAAAVR